MANSVDIYSQQQFGGQHATLTTNADRTSWPVMSCKVNGKANWTAFSGENGTGQSSILEGGKEYLTQTAMGMPESGAKSIKLT
jgi:hypothetical protein